MNISVQGKNAIVCGSTQGIGLAVAQELALLGANCILIARNETALQEAVATLDAAQQQKHRFAVADFSQPEQVAQAVHPFVAEDPVHILINNTGGPSAGAIIDADPQAFEQAFRQHVVVNQMLAQVVIPGMKKAGYGRLINIVSTSVRVPLPNLGVSNTIRAAVASWAKSLSNEVAQYGITINNVLPGLTETARLQSLIAYTASAQGKSETEVRTGMQASVPARRFGHAAEVAVVAAFLASPAAGYVNGTSIPVDGGRTGTV